MSAAGRDEKVVAITQASACLFGEAVRLGVVDQFRRNMTFDNALLRCVAPKFEWLRKVELEVHDTR